MTGRARGVVVTGAAGAIGRAVALLLPTDWDLRLTGVRAGAGALLDVTDGSACRAAFAGADAVVPLAGVPDPDARFEVLLPANVVGAYQVAEASVACRVRRLMLASSLHALSGYPDGHQSRAADPLRPANVYGATKA